MANAPAQPFPDTPLPEWDLFWLPHHNSGWFLVRGVLAILFGITALLLPGTAVLAAALVFAAFTFADGLFSLISGLRGARHHRERWGALIFNGLTGIAVGVLFVLWPLTSTMAYAFLLVAIMAAFYLTTGIGQIAAAIRLRKEMEGEWVLALLGASAIVLGAALIYILWAHPGVTLLTVAWLIGFYALMSGVFLIALSIRLRRA
ncbi:HdeD family acid-resistance protein [Novosphingobium beihaiensis]|uniref:DUF308 domain-containing protein n=1 Tax=Novosphingobium beihaiensis TaxID=2930389 RepID=A0ABT0BUM7_9SPHN|nr:DUF308 domain-containing protein [Novosphingobium beihaiensis]MCJ2188772.1 DUF308 domain-containing protein [Novosphingobium beihaiensis]